MKKSLQTMLRHHNARVNSHQRWKRTRFRVCFHLWCELTSTMNVTEWQVSSNSWLFVLLALVYSWSKRWTSVCELPALKAYHHSSTATLGSYSNQFFGPAHSFAALCSVIFTLLCAYSTSSARRLYYLLSIRHSHEGDTWNSKTAGQIPFKLTEFRLGGDH